MGARHCRRRLLALRCAHPPHLRLAPRAGRSTVRGCSRTRRRTSTTCSRWSSAERVDLVVVAGDVYDRALPQVDAVRLADETLARLAALAGAGGAHQRQPRLRPAARVQLAADRRRRGVHPHRRRRRSARPVLLDDEHGAGRRLRPPLPRPRRRPRAVGAAGPLPRGGADRGDAPGPRRPRRPAAAPGRSCSPTRSWPAPQPSDSERDISVGGVSPGADQRLRRRRLRRARPPARAAHADRRGPLQRLAAGLLLLRGRPHARARGWSTSAADGLDARRVRRGAGARGRWPGSAAPSTSCSPTPGSTVARGRLGAGDAHRRRPPAAGDGAAARAGSRTRWCSAFEPAGGDRLARPGRAHRAAAPTTTIALDFVADLRGAPATDAEAALLQDAVRRLLRRPRRRRAGLARAG